MNYIVDDIGRVVNLMRADKTLFKIFTDVLKFDLSTFDDTFDKTFTGSGETPPFYMYGHRAEISDRLREMENDNVRKYQKYPLIALRLDIPEQIKNGMYTYNLNLAILQLTEKNYNAEERMVNVFKPILYPLYRSFMDNLRKAGLFQWDGPIGADPPHTKIDRRFWGTPSSPPTEGTLKNTFSDPLDAIEILNLQIKSLKKC